MSAEIGKPAPRFSLADLDGKQVSLEKLRGQVILLNFWSCECPWSERADHHLGLWQTIWGDRVAWVSLASNADEAYERIRQVAQKRKLPVVLVDKSQEVANAYSAKTTPHIYVIDQEGILRYKGGIDDSSIRQRKATRMHAFEAVQALLEGGVPPSPEHNPFGCALVRHASEMKFSG